MMMVMMIGVGGGINRMIIDRRRIKVTIMNIKIGMIHCRVIGNAGGIHGASIRCCGI